MLKANLLDKGRSNAKGSPLLGSARAWTFLLSQLGGKIPLMGAQVLLQRPGPMRLRTAPPEPSLLAAGPPTPVAGVLPWLPPCSLTSSSWSALKCLSASVPVTATEIMNFREWGCGVFLYSIQRELSFRGEFSVITLKGAILTQSVTTLTSWLRFDSKITGCVLNRRGILLYLGRGEARRKGEEGKAIQKL